KDCTEKCAELDTSIEKLKLELETNKSATSDCTNKHAELDTSIKNFKSELETNTSAAAVLKEVQSLKKSGSSALSLMLVGVPIFILVFTV
ncbi:hypothetical protein FRX31_005804, partial [Thalictrum thalictroides]